MAIGATRVRWRESDKAKEAPTERALALPSVPHGEMLELAFRLGQGQAHLALPSFPGRQGMVHGRPQGRRMPLAIKDRDQEDIAFRACFVFEAV